MRHSRPIVLKIGGELLEDADALEGLAGLVCRVARHSPLLVVHGGGREIDVALARAGIPKHQVDGLRVTDRETLDVVIAVLGGSINTRLVAAMVSAGGPAVGLTGVDAGIVLVEPAPPQKSADGRLIPLGLVGEPLGTSAPRLLEDLLEGGYIPVVASIGVGRTGQLFNVNADTAAAHLAGRLAAARLVIAGATRGVLDESGATIAVLDDGRIDDLVKSGGVHAGMIAKLNACRRALSGGVSEVVIVDGRNIEQLEAVARGLSGAGTTLVQGASC